MSKGKVFKIHSDFYYIENFENNDNIVECKIREVLKKQDQKILVGDNVEFENGYMFSGSDDNKYIGGFNHTPICIRKSDGKVVDQVTFMLSNPGNEIRDFEV